MKTDQTAGQRRGLRLTALGAAMAAAFALPGTASAFEINTGNEDIQMRWDNTVRLNIVDRVEAQDEAMLRNPNFDDGDRNFDRGRVFTRLDLLTEFDFIYQRKYGFRVSAAGWWDPAYGTLDDTSTQTSNHLIYGRPALGLPAYTKRYAEGPSGEFLDVFAFGKFDIGEIPVNVKLGQTTVFWGESLLFNGAIHSVAYSQNPIDVWKALATPGSEAKELFRPRVGLNVQAQVAAGRLGDGPVLLQLAALFQPGVPLSGVGLVSVDRRRLAVGRRVADLQCHRHAASLARHRHHAGRKHRQLGPGGKVEPGVARRHARRLLPPHLRHAAASDGDAGVSAGSGSSVYAARRSRRCQAAFAS